MLLDDGVRSYKWGPGGLAYSVEKSSGAVQGYHNDGLGSVRAITDAGGNVVQTYQTDEFSVLTQTQGSSTQPFGFTGEQRDPEDGLVYLRARMYEPATGRLAQGDPVRKSRPGISGWNRYAYAASNPVAFTHSMGRCNNQTCEQQVTGIDNIVPIVLANIIGLGPDDIPNYVQRIADVITGFRGHAIDQVIELQSRQRTFAMQLSVRSMHTSTTPAYVS